MARIRRSIVCFGAVAIHLQLVLPNLLLLLATPTTAAEGKITSSEPPDGTIISHKQSDHHDHDHGGRDDHACAAPEPTIFQFAMGKGRMQLLNALQQQPQDPEGGSGKSASSSSSKQSFAASCETLCKQCINIDTYFNFIGMRETLPSGLNVSFFPHPPEAYERFLDGDPTLQANDFSSVDDLLVLANEQMAYLNRSFANTPFTFTHQNQDNPGVAHVSAWSESLFNYTGSITSVLSQGDAMALDVHIGARIFAGRDSLAYGLAYNPSFPLTLDRGVYIRFDTLPGGGAPDVQLGTTLVHEVGHWLGLHHTFNNFYPDKSACDSTNPQDLINDTPQQAASTFRNYNCSELVGPNAVTIDTCPNQEGNDPVFNYMNVVKQCEDNYYFSCGQVERMYGQYKLFRERGVLELPICSDGKRDTIVVLLFDQDAFEATIYMRPTKQPKWPLTAGELDDVIYEVFRLDGQNGFQCIIDECMIDMIQGFQLVSVIMCLPPGGEYELIVEDSAGNLWNKPTKMQVFVNGNLDIGNFVLGNVAFVDLNTRSSLQCGGAGILCSLFQSLCPTGDALEAALVTLTA